MRNPVMAVLAVGLLLGGMLVCAGVFLLGGTLFYAKRASVADEQYAFVQEQVAAASAAPVAGVPADPVADLPDGMRAMSIRLHPEVGVADGWLVPGAWVDVMGKTPKADEPDKLVTQVIVQKVRLLAVSTVKGGRADDERKHESIVTVAVTPEDAVKLADAAQHGPLSVVVRKANSKGE